MSPDIYSLLLQQLDLVCLLPLKFHTVPTSERADCVTTRGNCCRHGHRLICYRQEQMQTYFEPNFTFSPLFEARGGTGESRNNRMIWWLFIFDIAVTGCPAWISISGAEPSYKGCICVSGTQCINVFSWEKDAENQWSVLKSEVRKTITEES